MARSVDFSVFSVLVTGSHRGIGLGLVNRFLELPTPPKWVFATTLDLEGEDNKMVAKGDHMTPPEHCNHHKYVSVDKQQNFNHVTMELLKRTTHPNSPQVYFGENPILGYFLLQDLKELKSKHPNLVVLQLDVTKLESIQAAVKEVQKCVGESGLTLLINNAGLLVGNNLEKENAKEMMRVYSVNTIGPLQMSQACLPLLKMAAQRSPCQGLSTCKAAIINISSISGSIELMERWDILQIVAYHCSKTALNMLTKCQSLDYSAHGILCAAFHPDRVKTYPQNGEISVEESTQGIVTVLSLLSEEDNGTFVDWLGRRIPL